MAVVRAVVGFCGMAELTGVAARGAELSRIGPDGLGVDQPKQVDRVRQVAVEDAVRHVEQLEQIHIADVVDDGGAASLGGHDVAAAQDGQLLRDRRRGRPDCFLELPDAQRALVEQLEDPDPHRVGKRLEELGLELPQPLGVIAPLVANHAGNTIRPARPAQLLNVARNRMVSYHLSMHESVGPLGQVAERVPPPARSWAFAVNSTVDCSDIEITLLSFVVVGEFARVTGLVRIRSRPNVRLASVPELSLATADGSPLALLSAHVLPHGDMAWVSWLYQRPPHVLNEYEGRIDRVDLDHHVGGRVPRPHEPQHGAWVFRFRLPPAPVASRMIAALAD
jgi:hypothetical protein